MRILDLMGQSAPLTPMLFKGQLYMVMEQILGVSSLFYMCLIMGVANGLNDSSQNLVFTLVGFWKTCFFLDLSCH